MSQPPFRRIADEIRARVADGSLRPGDPVPSARAITRQWGVALATATRVLATLNAEGVTRPVPGRGTIVTGPAAPARTPARPARRGEHDPELSRERIVTAAISVADAEGLGQLSMRRVATELGTAAMSLYRHVGGKDELVTAMTDAVFAEIPLPDPPATWRARLELSCRLQWQAYRRHPWLAPALSITRPQLIPHGMLHTEWVLAALDGLGLTIQEMIHVHITLFSHMRGLAFSLEAEAQAEQDSGLTSEEYLASQAAGFEAIAAAGELPLLSQLVATDDDLDLDELFEFGLERLLDGVERYLADRRPSAGRTRRRA